MKLGFPYNIPFKNAIVDACGQEFDSHIQVTELQKGTHQFASGLEGLMYTKWAMDLLLYPSNLKREGLSISPVRELGPGFQFCGLFTT